MNGHQKIARCISIFICLLIASAVTTSCITTPRKKPPQVAKPDVKKQLNRIQIEVASGATTQALKNLQALIDANPGTDVADDAHIMMAEIYFRQKDYPRSYQSYMSVVNSDFFSPLHSDALLGAAKSLTKLGSLDEALSLTDQGLDFRGLSQATRFQLYELRYNILSHLGDRLDALKALLYLAENSADAGAAEGYRLRASEIVESQLSEDELKAVARDSTYGAVRVQALFRAGTLLFEQRDYYRAGDYFDQVVRLSSDSEFGERASHYIQQINARRKVDPQTIGAVLPLSGRHGPIAQKTLRGIQLGLGIFGPDRSNFRLAIIDSEDNPDAARRAVERLVMEDHVISVIGSLLSKTSVPVAAKANELGVPSLALSQKSGITDVGEFVFRNAITSEMLVRHLVSEAMSQGMTRFAILYPNDAYGVEYSNLFWDEVLARGGKITGAQPYASGETDFSGAIQRLVGTFYLEDRQDEYKSQFKQWIEKNKTVSRRESMPTELVRPIVDFDGLFVPDGIKALGQIAPMLAYHDVKQSRLLGTNLWNSSGLVQRGQQYVDGALFVDGLLASDESFRNTKFFKDFVETFGEEPGLFEAQGYDAGLMLRQVVASGNRSRVSVKEGLERVEKFAGSIGDLYMNENRELSRPLVTLTVHEGKIVKGPVEKPTTASN